MAEKDFQINFARFKTAREEKQMSVREVEEITGINRTTISNIETGKHLPDGVNLLKMMCFFNLSKEDIILSK